MKNIIVVIFISCICFSFTYGQAVSINSQAQAADASAMLDISSSAKGLLIPRLSTAERNLIVQPATALFIFNADLKQFQVNIGTPQQPSWQSIVSVSAKQPSKEVWQTTGNIQNADSAYIGNADKKPLYLKTNNLLRIYIDSAENKIGIGTNKPRSSLDINATDAIVVPVGTTDQRPPLPVVGMIRYNATSNKLEGYTSTGWVALN